MDSTEKMFSAGMEQMCFSDRDRTFICSCFRILSKMLAGMQVYFACTDVHSLLGVVLWV